MSDTIPSFDELLAAARKACADANLPWWDEEARAILAAAIPLVTGPAGADLDQALRQWKMYAEFDVSEIEHDSSVEGDLYRRARSTRTRLTALAEEAKGGG